MRSTLSLNVHLRQRGGVWIRLFALNLAISTLIGLATQGSAAEQPGLSRTPLLRTPDGIQVTTPKEWRARAQEIRQALQTLAGPMPGPDRRVPLKVQVEEETDVGNHVRRLITYQSEPGSRVPAYLSIPKSVLNGDSGKRVPAVLCLHPTDNQVGHKVVMGLGGKAGRAYGRELAEKGFVTLSPSYPLLANYQPDLEALRYRSGTMKAIWDNQRGLDLLMTLPYVRTNGFGAIGHSLGGHNAIYTAVFDRRLKVIISSCGFDSFLDYKDGNILGWTSTRYMPALKNYRDRLPEIPVDFHELIAALAPRHFYAVAPLHDGNFKWQSVDRVIDAARPVYELHNASDQLKVDHPDSGHDFPEAYRQKAYRLLEQVLGK